jgi:hypothetical protein
MGDDYLGTSSTYTITTDSDISGDYSIDLSDVTDLGASTTTLSTGTYIGSNLSGITFGEYEDTSRKKLRDEGELPIDIWAKMYNNGVIDDD